MVKATTRSAERRESATPTMRAEDMRDNEALSTEEEDRIWAEPKNLAAPPPRPGYTQRWCRTEIRGEMDHGNYTRAKQLGWLPRPADSVKGKWNPPTIEHGQYAGFIGVRGMILMEMPIVQFEARRQRIEEKTRRQSQAVNRDILRVQNPQVPFKQSVKSEVVMGKRRTPVVADDTE